MGVISGEEVRCRFRGFGVWCSHLSVDFLTVYLSRGSFLLGVLGYKLGSNVGDLARGVFKVLADSVCPSGGET